MRSPVRMYALPVWAVPSSSRPLDLARWLVKMPEPSATQIHEPKIKVVPFSRVLVKSEVAIESIKRSSVICPTVGGSCQCFTGMPT